MPDFLPGDSIPTLDIISSHKVSARTTRALQLLYPASDDDSPPAVALRARSAVAPKAIAISEIVKRRLGERGDAWWQYCKLETEHAADQKEEDGVAKEGEEDADEDADEEPFVPPREKAGERQTVAVLTIYVSRRPIEGFEKLYGVQTAGGGT